MAILSKDTKYNYCSQLSLWVKDVSLVLHMLEQFHDEPDSFQGGNYNCVVRKTRHGKYAVFTRGNVEPKQRYKLDVVLKCVVIPVKKIWVSRRST